MVKKPKIIAYRCPDCGEVFNDTVACKIRDARLVPFCSYCGTRLERRVIDVGT